MARHRNVRNMNFDDDYEGYNDVYGHSVEDNYCVSPSASQYLYNRGEPNQISAFFSPEGADIQEEPDEEDKSGLHKVTEGVKSMTLESAIADLVPEEEILLRSCLEEIQLVMGDSTPEGVIISEILRAKFNVEKALDACLRGATEPEHTTKEVKLQTRRDDRNIGTQGRGLTGDVFNINCSENSECRNHPYSTLGLFNEMKPDEVKAPSLQFEFFAKAHFEKVNAKSDLGKPIEPEPLASIVHENTTQLNPRRRLIAVESIMAMQAESCKASAPVNLAPEEHTGKRAKLVTSELSELHKLGSMSHVPVSLASNGDISQESQSQLSSNKNPIIPAGMNLLFALQKSATLKTSTNECSKSVEAPEDSGIVTRTTPTGSVLLIQSNSGIGITKAKSANTPNLLFAAQKRLVIKSSPRECTSIPADVTSGTQDVPGSKCQDKAHTPAESQTTGIHPTIPRPNTQDIKITSNGASRIRLIPQKRLHLENHLIKTPSLIGKRVERSALSHHVKPVNVSSPAIEFWSILQKHYPEKLFKFDVPSPDAVVALKLENPSGPSVM